MLFRSIKITPRQEEYRCRMILLEVFLADQNVGGQR
jgi:hypothetical protein